jgi:glyoxylase-like metal-dependent hydrolase (beta-lactamase superfamily II)
MLKKIIPALLLVSVMFPGCAREGVLKVERQVTGLETNCYLLYDTKCKEAALIDVGGPIDSLLSIIDRENLDLRYFLFTHGHGDHVVGLPAIRDSFPRARICIHRQDYDDLFIFQRWLIDSFGRDEIDEWCQNPEFKKLMDFAPESFGHPDIFIEDGQIFELGGFKIKTIYSPGHSPGCVCYYVDAILFSGDVLFHRRVGRTDLLHSSPEDMIRSVQKLYRILPDETAVYPGHGQFTDIGSEKKENEEIRADTVLSFN